MDKDFNADDSMFKGSYENKMESDIVKWVNEVIDKTKIGDFPEHYVTDIVMLDRIADKQTDYEKAQKENNQKEMAFSKECMGHYAMQLGLLPKEK